MSPSLKKQILNFLLPPLCPSCRKQVGEAGGLCVPCWSELSFIEEPYCRVLGYPQEYDTGEISDDAKNNPPHFDLARSVMLYNSQSKILVAQFKYHDRLDLAPLFSKMMMRAGKELIALSDVILPVPMHKARYFARQYNQAAELARNIAMLSNKTYEPRVLHRVKNTRRQVGLTQRERNRNLESAFHVSNALKIEGKSLLLIDDVMTTGATLNECAACLKQAGAKNVYVLTLARVEIGEKISHI